MSTQASSDLFPWRTEYETGLPSIDTQHQGLFRLVNELHQTIETQGDLEEISTALEHLKEYARSHFSHEESLMERYGYPGIQRHAGLHEHGFIEILNLAQELNTLELAQNVLKFCVKWITEHALGEDMEFIHFLQLQCGESPLSSLDHPPIS